MGMSKSDRLLHILNLLRSRRNLNAARLAQECGVTERSIYRDIISLSEANIPVYYDRGYKLASDNFLPPLNLDFEEYSALRLALESSPLARRVRYKSLIKRVSSKIEAGLSRLVRDQRRSYQPTTHIHVPTTQNEQLLCECFADLESAIADSLSVEMEYDGLESGRLRRVVDPYFIVFRARAFYIVGYCHLRGNYRTFRVDRIRSLAVSSQKFRRRRDITPESYFEQSWEVFSGPPVTLAVRFTGTAARVVALGHHHAGEEVVPLPDGSVEYRVTVSGRREIVRWLLGFGDEAEVISPPDVRDRLIDVIQRMANQYRKT